MTDLVFVDTNVFLYAMDERDAAKRKAAYAWRSELWKTRRGRTSFQVLQEFYVQVARKWPASRDKARAEVRDLLAWHPVSVDAQLIEQAWKIQDRYQFSFWDSLIAAAAQAASCRYLLTEDLQSEQEVIGVRVVNPFSHSPESLFA